MPTASKASPTASSQPARTRCTTRPTPCSASRANAVEAAPVVSAAASGAADSKAPTVGLPTKEAQISHIFRDKENHIADTPDNRRLLEDIANDPKAILGSDRHGTMWVGRTLPDGTQVWAAIRNGTIVNGGVNSSPRTFNPMTGLSASQAKGRLSLPATAEPTTPTPTAPIEGDEK